MSEGRKINCATEIRCHLPVPPNGSGDGEIRVYCAGGDVDGSACLSLAITTPVADIVVTLDGAEARALRAQIDEALRGPGVRR